MAKQAGPGRYLIHSRSFEPAYLALHRTGELQRRARLAVDALADCRACPRDCGVDRLANKTAACQTGRYALVSSHFSHLGEEDCLRGWSGSGTIFFARCNLRCVFCQNADISQARTGVAVKPRRLAEMMIELQELGCHNINFVTPEHVVPQIMEALPLAVEAGLRLPLVYNTSAYDSLDSLRLMDGVVDIYMPDFKLWHVAQARRYLKASDYPAAARAAFKEMHRQVGPLQFDEQGLARRGLLVRHLVMPGLLADTAAIMHFLAHELSADTYLNLMDQYYPAHRVTSGRYPEISRRITPQEYREAQSAAAAAGLWRLDRRQRFGFLG